eukprot:scaffold109812_cov41-Tisochrysis_lutea.AAC.1
MLEGWVEEGGRKRWGEKRAVGESVGGSATAQRNGIPMGRNVKEIEIVLLVLATQIKDASDKLQGAKCLEQLVV